MSEEKKQTDQEVKEAAAPPEAETPEAETPEAEAAAPKAQKPEAAEAEAAAPEAPKAEPAPDPRIEQLAQEAADWKNKYYRVYADSDNLRKRLESEAASARKYRIQSFALEVLPALDNLDRALAEKTADEALHKGVEMVRNQLWHALEAEGVTEIAALGKPFDGNYHHAIMKEKAEGQEPGTVIEVLQKGYLLKDRILRAALVKVSE